MDENQIMILNNLAWGSTPEQTKAGFIAALQETDHQYLLQPRQYHGSWDNCAIIFLMLSDKEIKPYLFNLLEWLQDLNWSGAWWILERLKRVSPELIAKPLERAVKSAQDNEDECWLGWMSILIANQNLSILLNKDILNILKPFAIEYWDFDYDQEEEILKEITNKAKKIWIRNHD